MSDEEENWNYRALIEHSSDAIVVHDLEGRILYANPAAIALAGDENLQEAMKKSVFAHLPADMEERGREDIRKLMDGQSLPPLTAPFFLSNGNRIEVEVNANVVHFRGQPAIQVHMRDVTHRKHVDEVLKDSWETERALINSPIDVAILLDTKGIILNLNDNYATLKGRSYQELLGVSVWDLMPAEAREHHKKCFDRVLRSKQSLRLEEKNGEKWYDTLLNPILSSQGNVTRVALIARDITERKKAEKQLKEFSENLQRSNEDLELFVHIATHDLQEPVRGIVTYSQLLLARCKEAQRPETERYLKVIEQAGLQMSSLVNDLREYSRIRTRARPFEPVDMEEILSRAMNNLQMEIRETQATITHEKLPTVPADTTQMTQVFQNLIQNAIKFHGEGIAPVIHASAALKNGTWQFAITDNGIGIPSEYYDKIFVLFERLHGKEEYPGTGLGLALCKRIIERHGGRIWVESKVGEGSTFFFTLQA